MSRRAIAAAVHRSAQKVLAKMNYYVDDDVTIRQRRGLPVLLMQFAVVQLSIANRARFQLVATRFVSRTRRKKEGVHVYVVGRSDTV